MSPAQWVGVSFFIFLAIVVWKGRRSVLEMLDKRTNDIRSQVEEARRLRQEAEGMLADYKRRTEQVEKESEGIRKQARAEAERMRRDAEANLERSIARRRDTAMQQIAAAEADAIREVRALAVEIAVSATRQVIHDEFTGDPAHRLIDRSIEELPQRLN